MKKFFHAVTALFFMLISVSASAQFDKGGVFVESSFGDIGFNKADNKSESSGSTNKGDSKGFNFSLYPRVGFFIADNFAIGAEVDIDFYSNKSNSYYNSGVKSNDTKTNSVSLGFGPFARYYFAGSKDGKSKFYGQLGGSISADVSYNQESRNYSPLGILSGTSKYDYKKKYNTLSGNAMLGWNHLLAENVALNLGLGYRYSKSSETYTYTSTPVIGSPSTSPEYKYTTTRNAVTWNLGFTMFFPSKNKKLKK